MLGHEFMQIFLKHPHLEVKMHDPDRLELAHAKAILSVDGTGPILFIGVFDEDE